MGKRLSTLLALVLLAGAGVGGYLAWRTRPVDIPPLATEGLDPELSAALETARSEVLGRPDSAETWGRLGMILFAHDLYENANEILAKAQQLDPKDARWPYFRGLALIFNKPDDGIILLQQAAALPPPHFSIRLRLAEEYLKLQRFDEADAVFVDLIAEEPTHARALLGHGLILLRRGQYLEALALLRKAAEQPTAQRSARIAMAEAHVRLGNTADAEAESKRAADEPADQRWPDPLIAEAEEFATGWQRRMDAALALRNEGKVKQAAEVMSLVLRDHPDSAEAHLVMAKILIRAKQMDRADKELRRTVTLNPNLVEAHFLLGGTQMARKDFQGAEQSYLRTVALKPMHAPAYFMLGDSRLKQGKKAAALEAFREAVRYRPDLVEAHLELGALLLQSAKTEEAIAFLDKAIRLEPNNDRAVSLLKEAQSKMKS